MLASLPQTTVVYTTGTGTETETDPSTVTETETGTVTVNVTTRSETLPSASETGTETEMSGTDAPTFLAAPTDEVMLHDHLLSFVITNPPMVPITCPLPVAMIPTTGVEVPATPPSTTGPSHHRSMTKGLHSTTVAHHHSLLLLMTVVSLWMIAR